MAELAVDHVIVAAPDLEEASRTFEGRYGLRSIPGGEHHAWGTANHILPLGAAYLELVAVADPEVARASAFGGWVARRSVAGGGLLGWAVRTDELSEIATRLGLEIAAGSRTRADGTELRWRLAGVEEAAAEPSLPFFIEWARGSELPGRAGALGSIEGLRLTGSAERLSHWLGPNDLPVTVDAGAPAVAGVRIVTTTGRSLEIGG